MRMHQKAYDQDGACFNAPETHIGDKNGNRSIVRYVTGTRREVFQASCLHAFSRMGTVKKMLFD